MSMLLLLVVMTARTTVTWRLSGSSTRGGGCPGSSRENKKSRDEKTPALVCSLPLSENGCESCDGDEKRKTDMLESIINVSSSSILRSSSSILASLIF